LKARLEARRDQLRSEMQRMSAPPDEPTGISFGKRVGEGTSLAVERLVQVAAYDDMQETLNDVERALKKLEAGTYGECDSCGTAIPPERLEIRPWAVLCVDCASR
jgi:DnaK suppressor protein